MPETVQPEDTVGLAGFDHFGVPVADRARAESFYSGVLGFPVLFRRGTNQDEIDRGFMPGTFFNAVGHPIAVFVAHEPLPPVSGLWGCPAFGFEALPAGLERILGRLQVAGIPFEGPVRQGPDEPLGRCVWLNDPDGNHLQIGTPGARRARREASPAGGDIIGISHLEVECTDLARALDFYVRLAGLRELRRGHDHAGAPMAWLLFPGGQYLVLHEVAALGPRSSAGYYYPGQHYAFDVRRVHWDALLGRLRARGIATDALDTSPTQTRPPVVADGIYLVDPDGNPLQFQELKSDAAAATADAPKLASVN
jgi:catechol 2,3-dioxygenase-like lactoylglutathione lyase family enzyme